MADKLPLLLELADGTEHTVYVDQRDHAAAEAEDLPASSPSRVTRMRFLAWSAARRAGVTKAPWPRFNTELCVNVEVDPSWNPEEPAESADDLDPGHPDRSAEG